MKKRRINKKRLVTVVCAAAVAIAIIGFAVHKASVQRAEKTMASASATAAAAPAVTPEPTVDPSLFTDPDSLLILANKKHKLPEGYEPDDLVAVMIPTTYGRRKVAGKECPSLWLHSPLSPGEGRHYGLCL